MSEYIISVDLGTTALKIALIDSDGKFLSVSNQEYELITPKSSYVEEEPEIYWKSFKKGLEEIKSNTQVNKKQIRAIGISAQGETLLFLDKKGKVLRNAIVWLDNRAHKESDILKEKFGDENCYKITGQVSFDPCWPASKILWVKNNEPDIFNKTDKFLLIEDYFIYRLTGKFVSEGSLLCSTVYWNIMTKKWWQEMLDYLQVDQKKLPEIMEPGEIVDNILPEVAEELGISKDTIICTGALDQAAGAIGVGNISEGIFSENIGAALAICAPVKKPVLDPDRNMPLHYFAIKDMYMVHSFTAGGMALRWFRDSFCHCESNISSLIKDSAYNILTREAEQIPPGSEGLIMLPHLSGSMAPDVNPKAKGVFYGFTLKHKKPHFIRAIMESIGFIIKRNIDTLKKIGISVCEIRSLGGGSKSSLWNQIKADITGKLLITMKSEEAACLGAAILAGKAVGMFKTIGDACKKMVDIKDKYRPDEKNYDIYLKAYKNYKKLFNDLTELFEISND